MWFTCGQTSLKYKGKRSPKQIIKYTDLIHYLNMKTSGYVPIFRIRKFLGTYISNSYDRTDTDMGVLNSQNNLAVRRWVEFNNSRGPMADLSLALRLSASGMYVCAAYLMYSSLRSCDIEICLFLMLVHTYAYSRAPSRRVCCLDFLPPSRDP